MNALSTMSANPAVLHARVGRTVKREDHRASVSDSKAMALGMQPPVTDRAQAFDYFSNPAARMGVGTASLPEATEYNLVRLSFNYWLLITLYRNHWISRRIVDVPASDMIRAWPKITSDIDPKDLSRIDRALRYTATKSNLLKAMKWARLFGGAGALIVIDGHENRLDEPLDLETIEPGAYRGLIPFDRWSGIMNGATLGTDIRKPLQFNLPETYSIQTGSSSGGQSRFEVHASRILRFCGPSVPTPEYEAQSYWGISSLEPAFEEIRKRDNMSWNILMLTYRANLLGLQDKTLSQAMSGLGMNANALVAFQSRMQAMNEMMSNQSLLLLPEDGSLQSTQFAFSGLSDIYQQFQLDISGAAQIPVTRLFGRTLTGLGSTNDADEQVYEEFIALEQSDQLRPQLDMLYPVICMSELGEVPDDLDLTFPSVRVLGEKEKAELASSIGNTISSYVNGNIFSKVQALKDIKQTSDVTGIGTNITDEELEDAKKEGDLEGQLLSGGRGGKGKSDGPGLFPGEGREGELDATEEKGPEHTATARDAASNAQRIELDYASFPLVIEYPAGSRRTLLNPKGEVVYDKRLLNAYGFIRNTIGRDGDEIDVIVGPDEGAASVFVVDMIDLGQDVDQREDEDKVCVGFDSAAEAKAAFLRMYPASFFGGMEEVPVEDYKRRIAGGTAKAAYSRLGRLFGLPRRRLKQRL